MRDYIQASWYANEEVSSTLESLSSVQGDPWPSPYIVMLAKRDNIIRCCDTRQYDEDYDLRIEIYVGRLLFELIACRDILVLFENLTPSTSHTPIAVMPTYPAVFPRSHGVIPEFNTLSDILRNAESTGYASLTDEQREKVNSVLNVELYSYQEQTVRWMLDKENGPHVLNDYFWEERSFTDTPYAEGGKFYYFPMTGEVRLCRPPRVRGGMVTEEMGLGKTVEALALIAAQREPPLAREVDVWCEFRPSSISVDAQSCIRVQRLQLSNREKAAMLEPPALYHGDEVIGDPDEIEFPGAVKVRRWAPRTTLVVCPRALIAQWQQEVESRAPSLTVGLWRSSPRPKDTATEALAIGPDAKDIVLATYDMVRRDGLLSKIFWKRLILDEAQVTRRSTAQIARDVFNLRSESRFLMTGTPFVNTINDLKGQLAFLRVWPFTLEEDGFWETYVAYPHRLGVNVQLLKTLLEVTMIRHSKAQQLHLDLPPRSYETIRVNLTGSHRACYYYVLASCLEELESQSRFRFPSGQFRFGMLMNTRRLRTLLRLLLRLCLSPDLVDVVTLDIVRRFTWSRGVVRPSDMIRHVLAKVSPQDAIRFVAESSAGLVRDSNRAFAMVCDVGTSAATGTEPYMEMSLKELRDHLVTQNVLTWQRAQRLRRERLVAIAAGGVHRIATDSLQDLRATATRLALAPEDEVAKWPRAKVVARLVLHYDLERGIQTLRTVHESGFAAIMKLVENRGNPSCPVCLMECEGRVAVTKCGHLYCLECMLMMLGGAAIGGRCAICRRDLSAETTVEIVRPSFVKEEEEKVEKKEEDEVVSKVENGKEGEKVGQTARRFRRSSGLENVVGETSGAGGSGAASSTAARCVPFVEDAVDDEALNRQISLHSGRMTAEAVWQEFVVLGNPPADFLAVGRDERVPSLSPEFLGHLSAARMGQGASPKLRALLDLIRSSDEKCKFCVVAGSVESLREIYHFLMNEGIECTGAGAGVGASGRGGYGDALGQASAKFARDENVRVFLLNPQASAGLTLTAASVVVFMETLVRVADEIQAAARVHRIGQRKDVRVVRIVARNTLEDKIVERRGEIRSAEEEAQALAMLSDNEASDRMILNLFGISDDDEVEGDDDDVDVDSDSQTSEEVVVRGAAWVPRGQQ